MEKNQSPPFWQQAMAELSAVDPVLGQIIASYPGELMKGRGDAFYTLARSITGQQISVKAADAVWGRLEGRLSHGERPKSTSVKDAPGDAGEGEGSAPQTLEQMEDSLHPDPKSSQTISTSPNGRGVHPSALRSLTEAELRAIGYSRQKVTYLHSLADFFVTRKHLERDWAQMDDEEVIQDLIRIRGIGRWSAEMFLIFYLQRPDVLPLDDIGLLKAVGRHYGLADKAGRKETRLLAQKWQPWRSVATWYLWRSLDPVPVAY